MNPNRINGTRVVRPLHVCPDPPGTEPNGAVMPKTEPPTMPEPLQETRTGSSPVERWREWSLERELSRLDRMAPEEFPGWARRRDRASNIAALVYAVLSVVVIGWGAIGLRAGTVEFPLGLVPYVGGIVAASFVSSVIEHVLVALYVWGPVKNRGNRR
jgi:hypothetical protein